MTLAFGVRSSASHEPRSSRVSTSFESIRSRYDAASGPVTPTKARGRAAARNESPFTLSSVGAMFRSRAEKKVLELGYDPARLPPGQYLTEKWPVLHAGGVAHYPDLSTWTLRVSGEVENELELSWEQFNELPRHSNVQDIHCVTRWSRFD